MLPHRTTLLNTDVQNCYITLEFITIILRVRHPYRSSVHRIVKKELQLKCLKKINAQELTAANKQARMTRAQQLLNKYPNFTANFMFLTDEKLFTVAAPTNSQNDRSYVRPSIRKKNVDENRLLQTRSTFSKSVSGVWTFDRWMPIAGLAV